MSHRSTFLAAVLLGGVWGCEGCTEAEPTAEEAPTTPAPTTPGPTGTPTDTAPTATAEAPPPKPWKDGLPPDAWGEQKQWPGTLEEQNEHLFAQIQHAHGITDEQLGELHAVFSESDRLGQGNPDVARHPVTVAACRAQLKEEEIDYDALDADAICGARYMVPLYDPETEEPEDAKACIDMFEFPDIPCAYPVTWARANEAVAICHAMGKRLCDAHEWEGGCAGRLTPPEENYNFGLIDKKREREDAIETMRAQQHMKLGRDKTWAYGDAYEEGVCATASHKSEDCGVGWRECGSNTFPAGYFPGCASELGVYDQHGNAAEHMNLPLRSEQMASHPSQSYGHTEMKGSWFIFDVVRAHDDHCRWRAPYWHGTRVMNEKSHRNYHLGFRCCKTIEE